MSIYTQFKHYELIKSSITYLEEHAADQPSLTFLAELAGLSPAHFQRIFMEYVGLSPKGFLQALTAKELKKRLQDGQSVLEATYNSGLSSISRSFDLLIKTDALKPGDIRKRGDGLRLHFGVAPSPFGWAFVAESLHGLSHLSFLEDEKDDNALQQIQAELPKANWVRKDKTAEEWIQRIFLDAQSSSLPLHLRGTPFQIKVWTALLALPDHSCITYGALGKEIGHPKASRAIGSAVGANHIAWLVPCHRVIRQSGIIGQYRWGRNRKKIMLALESNSLLNTNT